MVVSLSTIPENHNIVTMNALTCLCLVAVLVAGVWAGDKQELDVAHTSVKPNQAENVKSSNGAIEGDNGDHKGVGYGYAGPYSGHRGSLKGKMTAMVFELPMTQLDKLFERVRDVHDQVKTYSEQVDALSALLAIQEKKLKELVLVIFVKLKETDMRQNVAINKLDSQLFEIAQDNVTLYNHVHDLLALNDGNTGLQLTAQELYAKERAADVRQDRSIATLNTAVGLLKTKLLQIKNNEFAVFYDRVERGTTLLGGVNKRETRRMCEVGQITLDADDRKVEYQYQNWFDNVPQILWGLAGFNFNLDTREDPAYYGYGYPPQEPEAIGARVNAYSTKTGINLEAFDLSFGDTSLVSVDVAFRPVPLALALLL